ncbi:MAG: hypothetical protein E7302_15305 [Butyrivibrio sp.]|nr:hypothetical protein [Butyrivibrio sp.]
MTLEAYTNPEFTIVKKLIFLLAAFLGVIICDIIIYGGMLVAGDGKGFVKRSRRAEKFHRLVQLFYEMIISATSVMSFACAYVVLNHVYALVQAAGINGGEFAVFANIWGEWKDFVLLLLICLSCVFNTLLDKLIIPLNRLEKEDKASIRMLGMFYVILILMFLNVIGDESEYSPVMMYYLGLMVGRFVYFDASFKDFLEAIKNTFLRLPLLIIGLSLSGLLCFFGFKAGFLLERNYYIVGAFYTHLFLLVAVFVFRHSHILELIVREPKDVTQSTDEEL